MLILFKICSRPCSHFTTYIDKWCASAHFTYFRTNISRTLVCLIILRRVLEESVLNLIFLIWKVIFLLIYEPATKACWKKIVDWNVVKNVAAVWRFNLVNLTCIWQYILNGFVAVVQLTLVLERKSAMLLYAKIPFTVTKGNIKSQQSIERMTNYIQYSNSYQCVCVCARRSQRYRLLLEVL